MTEDELDEVCAEIEGYFPTVCARLTRAPKLLALWRRSLKPFPAPLVLDAVARAAARNSRTLELDDLLASIHYTTTLKPWLSPAARRARTPEDRLIAKLHCETVYRGLNRSDLDVQQKAAAQWRQWAAEYPAIRAHCLEQAAACARLTGE